MDSASSDPTQFKAISFKRSRQSQSINIYYIDIKQSVVLPAVNISAVTVNF